jgi:hypothetical protein
MFDAKKKLIVVYEKKDEIALNYLKQLVLSNDDNAETGEIIGTKDGSIEVIAWTEKVYLDNTKNRNVSNKIIFMDDIKGIEKIVPIMKVKYNKYGVKYGISGNNAVISIDEKELNSDNEYEAFQKLYKDELMKVDMKVSDEKLEENQKKRKVAKRTKARAVLTNILVPGAGVVEVASAIATGKQNIKLTREMMFLYAITKFYLEEMEDFINK